jgi:nitrite reductase/ring-hydroxylating ferredoxin subunit
MPDHQYQLPDTASSLPHVGTYRRILPVSLERLYENALDWAHLPHLHASSFAAIECLETGPSSWRANVTSATGTISEIELKLDRHCRRWITRTLSGVNAGAEIWTHAFPISVTRTDIVVDFFMPNVSTQAREKVGRALAALYQRLYDEDVGMMVERQLQLDRRIDSHGGPELLDLGPRAALALPVQVTLRGRSMIVAQADTGVDTELVIYPAQCPHQLGPLPQRPVAGRITCPWHGYQFDVKSGDCLTGAPCRLPLAAQVEIDAADRVWIRSRRL